jgi:hypothetical protein
MERLDLEAQPLGIFGEFAGMLDGPLPLVLGRLRSHSLRRLKSSAVRFNKLPARFRLLSSQFMLKGINQLRIDSQLCWAFSAEM